MFKNVFPLASLKLFPTPLGVGSIKAIKMPGKRLLVEILRIASRFYLSFGKNLRFRLSLVLRYWHLEAGIVFEN